MTFAGFIAMCIDQFLPKHKQETRKPLVVYTVDTFTCQHKTTLDTWHLLLTETLLEFIVFSFSNATSMACLMRTIPSAACITVAL